MMRIVLTLPGPPSSLGAEVRTPVVIDWIMTGSSMGPVELARNEVQFITEIAIDGTELDAINTFFYGSGLPRLCTQTTVYYYGDMARFIVGNLRLRGDT